MTTPNDTEMTVYSQLMQVNTCVEALKDFSYNIPSEDRYASLLLLITERLDSEMSKLFVLSLTSAKTTEQLEKLK